MKHRFDFLIIGSGAAGLTYALHVADFGTVGVVTKKQSQESNTNYAQGGIAAVIDHADSMEYHVEDTLIAGAGLCRRDAVELLVGEGRDVIRELIDMGAKFTRQNGSYHLGREGGHSRNRIVHAADTTGREIEKVLVERVRSHPNIKVLEHHYALELITEHHLGRKVTRHDKDITCYGAYVLDVKSGKILTVLARNTLLATGGCGQIYLHSTNPDIATGDGFAMAYRAKARIANMEFIQFHPTSLAVPKAGSFLISEAVRGHGAILRNSAGVAFMKDYDERRELAPRDIVARAIDTELKKRGDESVFLDLTHLDPDDVKRQFPTIYKTCKSFGVDITKDQVPVVPAAHYQCGGVITDLNGQTSIHHLFACGEVACTGVHGANRLASNSLLEAIVFARKAAEASKADSEGAGFNEQVPDWDETGTFNTEEWVLISHNKKELQQVMWDYVGIVRSNLRLERALRRTHLLYKEVEEFYDRNKVSVPLCQLRNMIAVAYLIITSSLKRKESRGLHYSTDYPEPVDSERHETIL